MKTERPNLERVLARLKDFQRDSVDYVFRRLYGDVDPINRFLLADEVGLGKTLVAKGVVARVVDELWDTVERIDVVYICSNADIARQNINRLNVTPDNRVRACLADHAAAHARSRPQGAQAQLHLVHARHVVRVAVEPRAARGARASLLAPGARLVAPRSAPR